MNGTLRSTVKKEFYAVTGATSRTGNQVAAHLLNRGLSVRAIGRSQDRLSPLVKLGAEAFVAEPTDARALTSALTGAKAVYIMLQPNYIKDSPNFAAFQDRLIASVGSALESSGVRFAVTLSNWGADKAEGNGPVRGLHRLEQRLNAIARLNVRHYRVGYFMENLIPQADVILSRGVAAGPFNPDLPMPMLTTEDIGERIAQALYELDFRGKEVRELLGQRDISMRECVEIIGQAIGKPGLTYIQDAKPQLRNDMLASGFSHDVVDHILEVGDAINSRHIRALEPRSSSNTLAHLSRFSHKGSHPHISPKLWPCQRALRR